MLLCEAGNGLELISCLSFRCTYIEQKLYELERINTVSKAMKLECWATIGSCVLCVGGIFFSVLDFVRVYAQYDCTVDNALVSGLFVL